jgi:peptide/nickel transport system substrate-binding protein
MFRLLLLLVLTTQVAFGANQVRYAEYGKASTLDPITSNDMAALRISELVFNGLVSINEKQEIEPELAERWEVADDQKIVFHLRKGVMWHPKDGKSSELTADDVLFTYNIMTHPKTVSSLKLRYEFIKTVRKLDKYTVEFNLKRPVLNALAKFTFKVIPQHGPDNPVFLTRSDSYTKQPIGTGPYRIEKVSKDGEVVFVANEQYFKGAPKIVKFVAKPFADQNIMNQALLFNAIDMIVLVNPRYVAELQADRRFKLQPYSALSYSFFGYNTRKPGLNDARVRRAFTHAINREEMLKAFFNGQGNVISGPFAPGSWAYNLDVKPLKYSKNEAIKLLEQAGYSKNASGVMEKDGMPLVLSLKVPIAKENEAVKRIVLAFKNYLEDVGARINIQFLEWNAWKQAVFKDHDFDIMFASWVFDDSSDISSLFHSSEIGEWKNNFGGYKNGDVDSLITESKLTLDPVKRRTMYNRLHRVLAAEAPYTYLWTLTNYAAYHKKIRKVSIHPYKFFSYVDEWYVKE